MICKQCGKEFERIGKMIFCSKECCLAFHNPKIIQQPKVCAYKPCSKTFIPKNANAKFCSSTCCTYQSHGDTTVPGWRERKHIRNAPKSPIFIKTCPITNKLFVASSANTKYHKDAFIVSHTGKSRYIYQPIPKRKHICAKCGVESEVTRRIKSEYCTSCYDKEWRRMNKAKRRAAIQGNTIESITPFKVFERDKWTCQLCGIFTPRVYRGTTEWMAPELDHIIPISKGGSHTMDNLQCLCRRCNINKGDKIIMKLTG